MHAKHVVDIDLHELRWSFGRGARMIHRPINQVPIACQNLGSSDLESCSVTHDGSMVLLYMVTWIPSIYPKC